MKLIKDKAVIRMIKIRKISLRLRNTVETFLAEWLLTHQTAALGQFNREMRLRVQ